MFNFCDGQTDSNPYISPFLPKGNKKWHLTFLTQLFNYYDICVLIVMQP